MSLSPLKNAGLARPYFPPEPSAEERRPPDGCTAPSGDKTSSAREGEAHAVR